LHNGGDSLEGNCGFIQRIIDNMDKEPDDLYCIFMNNGVEERITWGELYSDCQKIMRSLGGLDDGVVLIFLRHDKMLFSSFFGAMMSGNIPSFMPCSSSKQDPLLYWESHRDLMSHIRPSAIISTTEVFEEMRGVNLDLFGAREVRIEEIESPDEFISVKQRSEDDIGLLQHSSGTTGLKKGVALSFRSIELHAINYANSISITNDDCIASWLPLYHDMGLMACMIVPSYNSIPVVHLSPFSWVARPQKILKAIEDYSATLCWMPNFAFEHIATSAEIKSKNYSLESIRAFINCSEVCKPETFDRFHRTFEKDGVKGNMLQTCYAMAETVFATTQTPIGTVPKRIFVKDSTLNRNDVVEVIESNEEKTNGTKELIESGVIVEGIQLKIVDEDRHELGDCTIGEIAIKGDFLFSEYYKQEGLSNDRIENEWYFTRDLGFKKEGHLFVMGRIDDLIIINGRNVYSHQVELLASGVSGVKPGRVCAFGEHSQSVGSDTLVIVCELDKTVEREGREIKSEISSLVFSSIEIMPRRVILVEPGWLIKTSSGKMDRKKNKKKYLGGL
jgi:acyl-CoA synthetase (AMP-forming)/AMP-acid ligase II